MTILHLENKTTINCQRRYSQSGLTQDKISNSSLQIWPPCPRRMFLASWQVYHSMLRNLPEGPSHNKQARHRSLLTLPSLRIGSLRCSRSIWIQALSAPPTVVLPTTVIRLPLAQTHHAVRFLPLRVWMSHIPNPAHCLLRASLRALADTILLMESTDQPIQRPQERWRLPSILVLRNILQWPVLHILLIRLRKTARV